MKTDITFEPERAALHIKILHGLMDEVNNDANAEKWRETANRLYVLLNAMKPFVDELYQNFVDRSIEG